jgi:hypothetical protein
MSTRGVCPTGMSSRFKKKKKNDKRRHDDNFVAAVERKM